MKTLVVVVVMANSGGFSFDLCSRNAVLEQRGVVAPRLKKTGTTIVGLVYKVGWLAERERLRKASIDPSNEIHRAFRV